MVELVIQLFIIMVGKQIFNAFMEIGYPVVAHWFRRWRLRLPETSRQRESRLKRQSQSHEMEAGDDTESDVALYEHDYSLIPTSQQFIFDEYLEMGECRRAEIPLTGA